LGSRSAVGWLDGVYFKLDCKRVADKSKAPAEGVFELGVITSDCRHFLLSLLGDRSMKYPVF